MNEINYIGERLWAGQVGNAFVVLSFVAALLSSVSFYLSLKDDRLKTLARLSFKLHGFAVLGIAATLFFMLFNHFFEYQYVWQHSNRAMDMKYIFSCFWEGQEGSFLLWTFWNVVLGSVLNRQLKGGEWESAVMCVFALVQVFLASMLLGIYLFDYKIGSNPFLLLREHEQFRGLPFLNNPNYLANLDGKGLNTLLMNYWMTIHPPTLFLGFASTLLPFTFAMAGLWKRQYNSWQRLALPWTYFGILVLGVGILMGGAWAYEALNFGGFWAWDPVENSSLVPWLVLVGAGHTMIINRSRGGSLFTTHFLCISSFLLILYSTFLTRSGVLGNASVHAFTDLGMTGQLVMYVLTFVFLAVALLLTDRLYRTAYMVLSLLLYAFAIVYGYKKIILLSWLGGSALLAGFAYLKFFPREKDEEELYSREFFIFTGALTLLMASLIITYFTSLPVINKLFGTQYATVKVEVYNDWIMPFAMLLMLLIATSLYLKYKKSDTREFFRRLMWPALFALLFGLACAIPLFLLKELSLKTVSYALLFVLGVFAVIANSHYALRVLKGGVRKSGAAIAHIGFALILVGALVSTSKKVTLSKNTSTRKVADLGEGFDDKVSILLTKGDTLPMGPYLVTYKGKEKVGQSVYFEVDYLKLNEANQPEKDFTLRPRILNRSPEPATRHYLDRDIYTHVTAADLSNADEEIKNKEAYSEAKNYIGHVGDTIFAGNAIVVIDSIRTNLNREQYEKADSLLVVTAVLKAMDAQSNVYRAYPQYIIRHSNVIPKEDVIGPLGLKFVFWKINPDDETLEITMSERLSNQKDFIVMEAYVFPYINVLWLGCVIMALGTGIAVIERIRKLRMKSD